MSIVKKTLVDPTVTQAVLNYLLERPYKEVAELVSHLANSPTADVTIPDEVLPPAPVEEQQAKKPLASAAKRKTGKEEPKAEEVSEDNG